MIIRTSLLYILGVSTLIEALTALSQITVTEGSTAELNCTFENVWHYTPRILWNFDNKLVFERMGNAFEAGEGYESRVDVPEEKLSNGECTLVLKNVSLNDEGVYESVLKLLHPERSTTEKTYIKHVKLFVKEAPEPPKVTSVSANNEGKEQGESHGSSNDAGMKHPHPVIILLSALISTALFFLL